MKRDVAEDPLFKGKIEAGKYYDFSTPYGYGGWIIEGRKTEDLFRYYHIWIKKNGIICEFVRFHPLLKNHEKCGKYYEVKRLGKVVHMDLATPEIIWDCLSPQKRNKIRRAVNNDVRVYNGRFPDIFEEFQTLYTHTMERLGANRYYFFESDFYTSILESLEQNAQIFWAEKDKKVIAAAIILMANGQLNYHLSGRNNDYDSIAPMSLILYKAALWGYSNGYKTLNLGGGVNSREDSLFLFKKEFGKDNLNGFYVGSKIYDQHKYDELVSIREPINSDFFPLYRA